MFSVLDQIWNLPWYKVIVIAAADDVILILKLIPVTIIFVASIWVILFLFQFISRIIKRKK